MEGLDVELLTRIFGDAFSKEFALFNAAFLLAAWLHGGRVRKEIRAQMAPLTQAIIDLGAALRQDLSVLSERTGKVESGLTHLNDRVKNLETKE
jgi:hypothetical protein